MAKQLEPYKCAFSLSNEILTKAVGLSFKLGELSLSNIGKATDEDAAMGIKYLLEAENVSISPSQLKGLKSGGDVPSHPLATSLCALARSLPHTDPYDKSFLVKFEEAVWKEGVPHRLSRRVPDYPYSIPMHARIEDLIGGLFSFAKAGKGKVHPLVLSSLLYFEILAIAPYSEYNRVLAGLLFKAVLGSYQPVFYRVCFEKLILQQKEKLDASIAASVEKGDTSSFVLFMLGLLETGVNSLFHRSLQSEKAESPLVQKMLSKMESGKFYSSAELCTLLGLKSRLGLQKNYLRPALASKAIEMSNPLSPTDRTQRYRRREN